MLLLNVCRFTVSDHGLSLDVGATRTPPSDVVPLVLVREVRVGRPPAGWPRGRAPRRLVAGPHRVVVRHLADDGATEQAFTHWVRDPEAFAEALGVPLAR